MHFRGLEQAAAKIYLNGVIKHYFLPINMIFISSSTRFGKDLVCSLGKNQDGNLCKLLREKAMIKGIAIIYWVC